MFRAFLTYIGIIIVAVAIGPKTSFSKTHDTKRDGLIVEVPVTAFDKHGNLIDPVWKNYLQTQQPIGVIFFQKHFPNKNVAKNIVKNVKNAIGEKTLLCADEEGGRVNRIGWLQVPSAETIAQQYIKIKNVSGQQKAAEYVKQQYAPMFMEMQELGLNTTFAPNLDLNKYADLKPDSKEHRRYHTCAKYMKLSRAKSKNISSQDIDDYNKALLFLVYLHKTHKREIGKQVLNNRPELQNAMTTWSTLSNAKKQQLTKEFKPLAKYANYIAVVGDRSYGNDVETVGEIAKIFVKTAKEYNVNCVAKHALGHGRVDGDTHLQKQTLNATKEELLHDITPYLAIKNDIKFIMPSHITYNAIDPQNSAIHSEKVLDFIRNNVAQNILFITDDISMRGSDSNMQSPCDLWIVSSADLDKVKLLGSQNRLDGRKIDKIFTTLE